MRTTPGGELLDDIDDDEAQWEFFLGALATELNALPNLFPNEQAQRLFEYSLDCFPDAHRQYALETVIEYQTRFKEDLAAGVNPTHGIADILYGRLGSAGDMYVRGEFFVAPDPLISAGFVIYLSQLLGVWKKIKTKFSLEA